MNDEQMYRYSTGVLGLTPPERPELYPDAAIARAETLAETCNAKVAVYFWPVSGFSTDLDFPSEKWANNELAVFSIAFPRKA